MWDTLASVVCWQSVFSWGILTDISTSDASLSSVFNSLFGEFLFDENIFEFIYFSGDSVNMVLSLIYYAGFWGFYGSGFRESDTYEALPYVP